MIHPTTDLLIADLLADAADHRARRFGPSPVSSVARFDERVESMRQHPSATEPCKVIPLFGGDVDA